MKNKNREPISESENSDNRPTTNSKSLRNNDNSGDTSKGEKGRRKKSSLSSPLRGTSPQKNVTCDPLVEFLRQNPDATRHKIDDVISDNDEIYILEVPKSIEPESLIGKPVNLEGITKLRVNKTKYLVEPSDEPPECVNIMCNSLRARQPIASFKIREYTKKKRKNAALEDENFKSSIPDSLKIRHPLFGADFTKKLSLDEDIQAKLDNLLEATARDEKQKKKKKKRIEHTPERQSYGSSSKIKKEKSLHGFATAALEPESEEIEESIFALLENHSKTKKKQKKVKSEAAESGVLSESPKRKKRTKRERSPLDSEAFLERSTNKKPSNNKIKHKNYDSGDESEAFLQEGKAKQTRDKQSANASSAHHNSQEKKKKWDRTKHHDNDMHEEGVFEKKPKKKNNIINSTVISGLQLPLFEFDVSGITKQEQNTDDDSTPQKKKAKKKEQMEEMEAAISPAKRKKTIKSEFISEVETDLEDGLPVKQKKERASSIGCRDAETSHRKKQKKIKSECISEDESLKKKKRKLKQEKREESNDETSSLIFDILNKVKSELMESSVKVKKK